MDSGGVQQLATAARILLTAQLFIGGQARLSSALTPQLYEKAMAKAEGTRRYLSFIPIQDPHRHTSFLGALMVMAGILLTLPVSTCSLVGGVLSITLTLAGVYSQLRMGIPYWLPSINTVLAAIVIYDEMTGS